MANHKPKHPPTLLNKPAQSKALMKRVVRRWGSGADMLKVKKSSVQFIMQKFSLSQLEAEIKLGLR